MDRNPKNPPLPARSAGLPAWREALHAWPGSALLVQADFTVRLANEAALALGVRPGVPLAEALAAMAAPPGAGRPRPLHFLPVQGRGFRGWFVDLDPPAPAASGRRQRQLELRLDQLQLKAQEESRRRRFLERQILQVSDAEKRRIGMELHDDLGQHLTGIAFLARALEGQLSLELPPAAPQARRLVELVNQGIGKTRALSRGLWPATLQGGSLDEALQGLARDLEANHGVYCAVATRAPDGAVSAASAHHVFRILQEAATNGIKHGQARRLRIALDCEADGRIVAELRDDGVGLPARPAGARPGGQGLVGMQLRADLLGGDLEFESSAGGGTTVRLAFPRTRNSRPKEIPSC